VDVPGGSDRLDFNFLIAQSGPLDVSIRYGLSTMDGSGFADHVARNLEGASVLSISRTSKPPLREGIYYFRLSANQKASGMFLVSQVRTLKPENVAIAIPAQADWPLPALAVLVLLCIAGIYWLGRRVGSCLDMLQQQWDQLALIAAKVPAPPSDQQPAKPAKEPAAGQGGTKDAPADLTGEEVRELSAQVDRLFMTEPMLVLAKLVRSMISHVDGSQARKLREDYASYLTPLDAATIIRQELGQPRPKRDVKDAIESLENNIAAVRKCHNPRFFLDIIDEAEGRRMPELTALLELLGIESINPPVGHEVSDVSEFHVARTTGQGRLSILDKVIARGYRSKETGEVYRQPSVAIRLVSNGT
jgi:hypothetical protein